VHQLISTVEGLAPGATLGQVLAATFPMGSMTGAPKQRVLELTEALEPAARGLYSGSVGYVAPNGDFDFNVVIRSLQYQAEHHHLSYHVGGAITAYSQPQEEYEECLLKAAALRRLFA
jgi:para-aminobenzoate synthetase component 1